MNRHSPARVVWLTVVLLVALGSAAALQARPRHRKFKKPAPLPEQFEVLDAVDPAAGTVGMHHVGGLARRERTLSVTGFTEVTVAGRKAAVTDLKPGMRVNYTLGGDGSQLASIASVGTVSPTGTPTASPAYSKGTRRRK